MGRKLKKMDLMFPTILTQLPNLHLKESYEFELIFFIPFAKFIPFCLMNSSPCTLPLSYVTDPLSSSRVSRVKERGVLGISKLSRGSIPSCRTQLSATFFAFSPIEQRKWFHMESKRVQNLCHETNRDCKLRCLTLPSS